jgi:hypothetical protein
VYLVANSSRTCSTIYSHPLLGLPNCLFPRRFSISIPYESFFLPYINGWNNLFQIFNALSNSATINLNTFCPQRLQGARRVSAPIRQQTVPDMRQRSRKCVCSRNSPVSRGLRLLCVWKNVCPRAKGNLSLWSLSIKLLSCPAPSDMIWYGTIFIYCNWVSTRWQWSVTW